MSTKTQPADDVSAGSAEVFVWRLEQLESHGFGASLAAEPACDSRFDLHRLIELAERGCPPQLAARTLAPMGNEKRAC